MKIALSLLLLFFASMDTHAQTPKVDRIDVENYGIITATLVKSQTQQSSPSGQYSEMTNYQVTTQARTVTAQVGTIFGFTYWVIGTPNNSRATLRLVVIYPPAGLRNSATGETFYRSELDIPRNVAASHTNFNRNFSGYAVGEPSQAVPGPWVFQLWYQGRKLAEQTITVVMP